MARFYAILFLEPGEFVGHTKAFSFGLVNYFIIYRAPANIRVCFVKIYDLIGFTDL